MGEDKTMIKKIPYGISDYEKIINEGFYYVDKTPYLEAIENAGQYLFFIRPRRFGKSLFLSLMETYYDVARKERFDDFFKNTYIQENPTEEKNCYLILKFNFSTISPQSEHMEASFLNNIKTVAYSFFKKYKSYLSPPTQEERWDELNALDSPSDILFRLLNLCQAAEQKLYVVIDEYDNFANSILATDGQDNYKRLTHGDGFFRQFFKILKSGTTGSDAPISRLFITGVSPITLDDVTSGFNIGKNISLDMAFNEMLGFRHEDVVAMIDYYRTKGKILDDTNKIMQLMERWYGNYRFAGEASLPLMNSDMVLYFLDEYFRAGKIPEDLIDRNVRIDYSKLRHLIIIDQKGEKTTNGNFSRLREIIEKGEIVSKINRGFPLEEMESSENFISLLFYFGLLTLKGKREGLSLLTIPNQVVRSLYYDYIIRVSQETGLMDVNIATIGSLLHRMAYHGEWRAFFEYLSTQLSASTSIRDYFREEKVIQGFLLAFLGISDYFIVYSEKELNKGYADIVMEPFLAGYQGIRYSYILEIKFIPHNPKNSPQTIENKINQLLLESQNQLSKYSQDPNLKKALGSTQLIKLTTIFQGSELKLVKAVD